MHSKIEDVPKGVWCWLIHHKVLLEMSTEPLARRVDFIRKHKRQPEIPTRLKWMRPVKGELPEEVVKAGEAYMVARRAYDEAGEAYVVAGRAYDEAGEAYDEARWACVKAGEAYMVARRVCNEARRAYDEALRRNWKAIERLHAEECPGCPWDGKTLFPEKEGDSDV
jgi:hypothetical protein